MPHFSPGSSPPLQSPPPSPTSRCAQGYRERGLLYQSISDPLCSSFLLTLLPCFSVGLPWVAVLHEMPATVWALNDLQLPLGHIYLLQCGGLHGLQCGYLLQHGLLQELQRNLCSSTWSISSPSSLASVFSLLFHTSFPSLREGQCFSLS